MSDTAGASLPISNPSIWFVGLTTLDVIHRVMATPAANQKVTAVRQDVVAGGPAANAAVTAAALGARAVLVSALGDSPVARVAKAELAKCGVTVFDVVAGEADFPLAVSAIAVLAGSGERSVVSADAALATAPAPSADALAGLAAEHGYPRVVLIDGHHGEIARAVVEWVENTVIPGEPEPRIVLDCGRWRPIFGELFNVAEVVACSADFRVPDEFSAPEQPPTDQASSGDAAADQTASDQTAADQTAANQTAADQVSSGATANDDDTIGAILDELAQAVVITHGGGAVVYETQEGLAGEVAVPAVPVRDTLAAGDAFHGALAVAVAKRGIGSDGTPIDIDDILPQVIEDAVAVATARVQHIGPRGWLGRLG